MKICTYKYTILEKTIMLTQCLNGKLTITTPDNWNPMDDEMLTARLTNKEHPFLAISSDDLKATCMLFYTDENTDVWRCKDAALYE